MDNYSTDRLDLTFRALADPTRRAIVARLSAADEVPVSEIARPFAMSLPALMKHLAVLEEAGIVLREKRGRVVHCRLLPDPLAAAKDWLAETERFWNARLDALTRYLEDPAWTQSTPARASRSDAGSKRRPSGSSRRGRRPAT